jgi:hypothetical protein
MRAGEFRKGKVDGLDAESQSPTHRQTWASALDEGVKQLHASGELARILGH